MVDQQRRRRQVAAIFALGLLPGFSLRHGDMAGICDGNVQVRGERRVQKHTRGRIRRVVGAGCGWERKGMVT